jgi:hypothetical protein
MDLFVEFAAEVVLELVLEGIFGLTIENPKVKTWVKTTVFVVFSQAVAGFVWFLAWNVPAENGDYRGNYVCGAMALVLTLGFLLGAIRGHKRNWKQD